MKTIITLFFSLSISLVAFGQSKSAGYYSYETECLSVEMDGTQTLKAWGKGRNRKDAIEQAKKNAIRDVIFKGIRSGSDDCEMRPLITEVNAQDKHRDYFYSFFTDGGKYSEFVSTKGESIKKSRKKAGEEVTYSIVVRVLTHQLRKQLITDKLINE